MPGGTEIGRDRTDARERRVHRLYARVNRRFRVTRMRRFQALLAITPDTRVLDIGGTAYNWEHAPVRPRLTLVNLEARPRDLPGDVAYVRGDVTRLPFDGASFDVVFSNSVIEHLGTEENQAAMAREVVRVGRRYFVQTPDARFPVEPHLLTPFIHFLPRRWRARLLRNFTVWGWITRPTRAECDAFVEEVRLLDPAQMRRLFPDARIVRERVLGLSKSLLAVSE